MILCDQFRLDPEKACDQEAQFAVKVGRVVGRYCGEHLCNYLEAAGEPLVVFPASASDLTVLSYEPSEIFPD